MNFGSLRQWSFWGIPGSVIALAAATYFVSVPDHPHGFAIDESSICYNAYTISQSGCDEYGNAWPLFFRAFGEYKNPTVIYILAALFRITGPSIAVARLLSASFGVLAGLLLGLLAWQISRRWVTAALVTVAALLTPWLFESSRLVFEVAIYPALVVLFLLTVWRAYSKPQWNWFDCLALAGTLSLLTYSYSIGRLLAPLLALGLGFFMNRARWQGILGTWVLYGLLLVPLFIFHRQYPGALTGRFAVLTYLTADKSIKTNISEFARHYLANINPWRWFITGEGDIRDHLQGSGSLLAASVFLGIAGLLITLRRHRNEAWWRFLTYCLVVSPVPASLTSNPFPQLRLVAFPVFFLLIMIPAITWLGEPKREVRGSKTANWLLLGAAVALLVQGLFFQWRYHQTAPSLWYVFDARFPRKVLAPALATGRPVVLLDEPGKAGYIHALWYGVLAHLDSKRFLRLPLADRPPPGSVVISTQEECHDCRLIARALNYIVYLVPPFPGDVLIERRALPGFQADIVCENPPSTLISGQTVTLRFLIKNIGATEWPAVGISEVTLQNRWRNDADTVLADHDAEHSIPYDVEPADTVGLVLRVTTPAEPGQYVLEVDLVQEQLAPFSEHGWTLWRRRVTVVAKE
jgi:hypothetical protein